MPRPVGQGFIVGWNIFRITVWLAILVWLEPRLLERVGGDAVARWLIDHRWVRVLGALPLGFLALISAFEILNDPKKHSARQSLATSVGGSLVDLRSVDASLGIPDGPGIRMTLGSRSMTVGTWKGRGKTRTVATVVVSTGSTFSFLARGSEREPGPLRGLQQLAVKHSIGQLERQGEAMAAFAYLADPPITTGHEAIDRAVVLRSNHPEAARAMFTSASVASALVSLNTSTRRWDWSYYPQENEGRAEMRLEWWGSLGDEDTLRSVRALTEAALDHLDSIGQIAA